jgi:protoporphyrinogen oxidase
MKYVIVGSGPCGLAICFLLAKTGQHDIILIDDNETLGGIHRVTRVDNKYFSEHSPRLYSSTYVNTIKLLKDMGINFNDYFTPYNFNISSFMTNKIQLRHFLIPFLKFLITGNCSDITMEKFIKDKNIGNEEKENIDRICRLTDGAGISKYSLKKFIALINEQYFHQLYQPSKTTDTGLFKEIRDKLQQLNVNMQLNKRVVAINSDNSILLNDKSTISADKIIFSIAPIALRNILKESKNFKDVFGPFDKINDFAEKTEYADYIGITYHWKNKLDLPKRNGFPISKWGLGYVVTSDYAKNVEEGYKTVISTALTITNEIKDVTKDVIIKEAFLQLKESYPDIPEYDYAVMNPKVYYNKTEGIWEDIDSGFVQVNKSDVLPFGDKVFYTLGTHNGYSKYSFTSMESAVSNALKLGSILLNKKIKIKQALTIRKTVWMIITFLLVILIMYIVLYNLYK